MADEADKPDTDEELDLADAQLVDGEQDADTVAHEEGEDEEEVLTFGDDLAEEKESDSGLIKHLRNELKQTRDKLREAGMVKPEPIEVGEKPTLSDCEFDEDKYEAALDEWKERKAAADRSKTEASDTQQRQQEAWNAELKRFTDGSATLGFADVEDAKETVLSALGDNLMGAMIMATDNPARVTYALYKHPDRLAELAKLASNPIKFIAAVAKLEGQLKVVKKRKTAEPEKIERGSGSTVRSTDKHLEKLEKEAEKSADYSAVAAYKAKPKT